MKTADTDMESYRKFINDLGYAKDCITDIQVRLEKESFETNEEILDEIGRASDFLIDAEKHLKKTMEDEML